MPSYGEGYVMILCDIGNTSVDWYKDGLLFKESVSEFDPDKYMEDIYYICVNSSVHNVIKGRTNWYDIGNYVLWDKYYPTMGIDRIMVCEAIDNGTVIDAGSAITIDCMEDGKYSGGFITLGVRAAQDAYARLSPALAQSFNFEVDLDKMAKNTPDAITIGFLAPLVHEIERLRKPIYVTGGDSSIIAPLIEGAMRDDALIFKGMEKLIKKGNTC